MRSLIMILGIAISGCYESYELRERGALLPVCSPDEIGILPGDTVALSVELSRDLDTERFTWSLYEGDPLRVTPMGTLEALELQVRPEYGGTFIYRFDVMDDLGREESCSSTIVSVDGPPYVRCHATPKIVPVGRTISLRATIVEDVGIESTTWTLREGPDGPGSISEGGESVSFRPDAPGPHIVDFEVRDVEGYVVGCSFEFEAMEPPTIECPEDAVIPLDRLISVGEIEIEASSGEPTLRLDAHGLSTEQWTWERSTHNHVSLRISAPGEHVLVARVEDDEGLYASCSFNVRVYTPEPQVSCPALIRIPVLTEAAFQGMARDEDGVVVMRSWSLLRAVPGSRVWDISIDRGDGRARFTPDLVGDYLAEFTARDDDGHESKCSTTIRAQLIEGLRVELSWDSAADFDLHLLHPEATQWSNPFDDSDCYWRTRCNHGEVTWFSPSVLDDPLLLLDVRDGFGPEVTRIMEPAKGSYAVGVEAFENHGSGAATLTIYCAKNGQSPVSVLGPTFIGDNQFWRAAEVIVDESGFCTVAPMLNPSGGPDVVRAGIAYALRSGYVVSD